MEAKFSVIGEELVGEREERFAGGGLSLSSGLGTCAVVLAAVSAVLYGLRWGLGVPQIQDHVAIPEWLPSGLGTWGLWSGCLAGVMALGAILIALYPVKAMRLWLPSTGNKDVRRVGLRIGRRWRQYFRASFTPVRARNGDWVYPGLESVRMADDGRLMVRLRLPDQKVPNGRGPWITAAAEELKAELGGVKAVEVERDSLHGRYAILYVVVRDLTMDTRQVEL